MDLGSASPNARRAARVLMFDEACRVLLLHYAGPGYDYWITPGGRVEPGESDQDAVLRELEEELGMTAEVHGPVHTAVSRFHHEGEFVENTDCFFVARVPGGTPPKFRGATPFEIASFQEVRWWTADDLRNGPGNTFPRDLPKVIDRVCKAQPSRIRNRCPDSTNRLPRR